MSQKKSEHDELDNINLALSNSEQFIEKYQKPILIAVTVIIIAVCGFLAVRHFYLMPREQQAQAEMYKGVFYFEKDSFQVAANGNGADFKGFAAIADDYSFTDAANLASAYAGISFYNLGQYEQAIKYLKKFDADEQMIAPSIIGTIGDSYVNMDKFEEGVSYFEKAAKKADNEMLSPIYLKKAGIVYEKLNNHKKALEAYQTIKDKYSNSVDAQDIDKYITRASEKSK